MSVKAKLLIDDKEINVLRFSFRFNQGADVTGRPSQKPRFAGLQLVIETRKDLNLADWSFVPNQTKQLELHIYPIILGGRTRELYFYDCHLVNWNNNFSSTGNQPMSETLEITCAGVEDSNSAGVYSSYWRETFKDTVAPTTINNEEETLPNLKNYHFEDADENVIRKEEIKVEDVIYLVLNSENAIGESVTINLDDDFKDYEHNGNPIANDILKDVLITDDICKIKLKAIKQQD